MALSWIHSIVVVVVLTYQVSFIDGCSCEWPEPNNAICTSDVAINATVNSISYPEGVNDVTYPVRYHLNVHKVINKAGDAGVPNVVDSYLPGSMCGLPLTEGATYVLAGSVSQSSYDVNDLALDMGLCNLHMYVGGGSFGSYHDLIDDIVEQIDCSNPPLYNNVDEEWTKRNQREPSPRHNAKLNSLRELGIMSDRNNLNV